MRGRTLIAASAVAVTLAGATPASSVTPLERSALKALATSRVTPTTKERGRAEVRRAAYLARTLPSGRREHVGVALGEIASFAGKMTEPRALALIGELKANDDYFLKHYAPAPKTDITDADGVVYRYFAGRCFEFHPLANFGALNARVAAGRHRRIATPRRRARRARRLPGERRHRLGVHVPVRRRPRAVALRDGAGGRGAGARARLGPRDGGVVGTPRQGARRIPAIPGRLLTSVAAGPWIRLYSFTSLPVLNAQLQAVISLQSYATTGAGPGRLGARDAHAARGGRDAAALRHRLLELLRAAARSFAARLPRVRRAAAAAAQVGRPALRRRRSAVRRVREAAAGVPARSRLARRAVVLDLEALDGLRRHRRRPVAARLRRRGLAHAFVGRAEASGRVSRSCHRNRLGR